MEQTEEYKRLYSLLAGLSSKAKDQGITPMISLGDLLSSGSSRRSTPTKRTIEAPKKTELRSEARSASGLDPKKLSEHETPTQASSPTSSLDSLPLASSKPDMFSLSDFYALGASGLDPKKLSEHATSTQTLSSTPSLDSHPLASSKPDMFTLSDFYALDRLKGTVHANKQKVSTIKDGTEELVTVKLDVDNLGVVRLRIDMVEQPRIKRKYVRHKPLPTPEERKALKEQKKTQDSQEQPPQKGGIGGIDRLCSQQDQLATFTAALEARCRLLISETTADLQSWMGRGNLSLSGSTLHSLAEDTFQSATQTWDGRCRICDEVKIQDNHFIPSSPCYAAALANLKQRVAAL